MFWIILAAATQLSMPVALGLRYPDVRGIFSSDDFPAYMQAAGTTRSVDIRVVVQPDGILKDCEIESSSGDTGLDRYTCGLIMKRARFSPAKWLDGSPAYGVIRVPVVWAAGSPPSRKTTPADLELTVNQLPKGVGSPAFERLILAVDESGHASFCQGNPFWAPGMDQNNPQLVAVACRQVTKSYVAAPPKDDTGKTVRSVQNVVVRFDK
jgi:TonB family protein